MYRQGFNGAAATGVPGWARTSPTMSGKPGSLNYLLTRPLPNPQPVAAPPVLPSISVDVQDGVRASLRSARAKSIFRGRVTIAAVLAAVINLVAVFWMVALNRILRFELCDSVFTLWFIPIKHMFTTGLLYTLLSSGILAGLVWSFSYQSSWTRLQMTSRISRALIYTKFPVYFHFWTFPLGAGCLARCYLGLIGYNYSGLTQRGPDCTENSDTCLDERNLFISFCAGFCGIFFTVQFRALHEYIINFPIIALPFMDKLRTTLRNSVSGSACEVVKPIFLFYLIYYVQGDYLVDCAADYFNMPKDASPLARISNILSLDLLVCTFVICTLVLAFFKSARGLFQICVTERLKFPIEYDFYEEPGKSNKMLLSEGVGSTSYYLKYLALYDLKHISGNEEGRLLEIFKLSHPGCNPINWISLMHPCLNVIEDARKAIKAILESERRSRFVSSTSDEFIADPKNPNIKVLYSSLTPLCSNGDTRSQDYRRVEGIEIRNLARVMKAEEFEQLTTTNPLQKLILTPSESFHALYGRLSRNIKMKVAVDKILAFVKCIGKPEPMDLIMKEMAHFNLLAWSSESLTNIACASLLHDLDGAVQQSLGKLISVQIEFYETLLEVQREAMTNNTATVSVSGEQGQKALKILLKTLCSSLARLYYHFYPHLNMLQICPKLVVKWKVAVNRENDGEDVEYKKEKQLDDEYIKHKYF